MYTPKDTRKLYFIMTCKEMGFTLGEIKTFLSTDIYEIIMKNLKENFPISNEYKLSMTALIQDKIKSLIEEKKKIDLKIDSLNLYMNKMNSLKDKDHKCNLEKKLDAVL